MQANITPERLIEGSKRINQMKSDIDWIARTIFGFLDKSDIPKSKPFSQTPPVCDFIVNGFLWRISADQKAGFCCTVFDAATFQDGEYWYARNRIVARPGELARFGEPTLKNVRPIYDGIQQFIDNMIETFPQLKERIAPLLDATK